MAKKLKRRRPQFDRQKNQKEGILTPSNRLFKTIDREVSLNLLKEDVIASVRNREKIIEAVREILTRTLPLGDRSGVFYVHRGRAPLHTGHRFYVPSERRCRT